MYYRCRTNRQAPSGTGRETGKSREKCLLVFVFVHSRDEVELKCQRPINGNNVGLSGSCPMFLIVQPYLMMTVALVGRQSFTGEAVGECGGEMLTVPPGQAVRCWTMCLCKWIPLI